MLVLYSKHYCDMCGTDLTDRKREHLETNVLFTTEQTEGRSCEPYIQKCELDFCQTCFKDYKKTLIRASGAQGNNDYWFRERGK